MNLLHLVSRNPHRVLPKWGLGFSLVSLISGLEHAKGVVGILKKYLRHEKLVLVSWLEVLHLVQAALDAVVGPLRLDLERAQNPIETSFRSFYSD